MAFISKIVATSPLLLSLAANSDPILNCQLHKRSPAERKPLPPPPPPPLPPPHSLTPLPPKVSHLPLRGPLHPTLRTSPKMMKYVICSWPSRTTSTCAVPILTPLQVPQNPSSHTPPKSSEMSLSLLIPFLSHSLLYPQVAYKNK